MGALHTAAMPEQEEIEVVAAWQERVQETQDPVARATLAKAVLLNRVFGPVAKKAAVEVLLQEAPKISEHNAVVALDLFRLAASYSVKTKREASSLVKWRRCFRALESRGIETQMKDASIAFGLSPLGSAFQKMASHECRRLIRKKAKAEASLALSRLG